MLILSFPKPFSFIFNVKVFNDSINKLKNKALNQKILR